MESLQKWVLHLCVSIATESSTNKAMEIWMKSLQNLQIWFDKIHDFFLIKSTISLTKYTFYSVTKCQWQRIW